VYTLKANKSQELEHIQNTFSIKDLENFSGIKAHTIRIWEQRYSLLSPERTEGNQRKYSLLELQKLLNVKYLYENGFKISKIAKFREEEIPLQVVQLIKENAESHHALDAFKLAMLKFDQVLFERTYSKLMADLSFRRIFLDVFIPLLQVIGDLWQANSITPAHEHFISNLIQQKLVAQIERHPQVELPMSQRTYVLYLPHGEIHDLGLLYLHYELSLRGERSIYLGRSVPLENLNEVKAIYPEVTFISQFTVEPSQSELPGYIDRLKKEILNRKGDEVWLLGRKCQEINQDDLIASMRVYDGAIQVIKELEEHA